MVLEKIEKSIGLPSLRSVADILSGENGKRIEAILSKLEKVSGNQEMLANMTKLMELIHAMGISGDLDKLDSILKSLPKGKAGESMVAQLGEIIKGLDTKIDRLSKLAKEIMGQED